MDYSRTLDQRRCGKTWKRQEMEFGESVHFRPVGEQPIASWRPEVGARCLWDITRDLVLRSSSRQLV